MLDPAIDGDKAKQAFLDGKAPYMITGPWNTTAFTEAGMDISVLPIPSAGGQPAQPFVGVQGCVHLRQVRRTPSWRTSSSSTT